MNFNQVLDWVKSNVLIVVFVVLMIAALVTMPFVASSMNTAVKREVEARGRMSDKLKSLRVNFRAPGQTVEGQPIYVNEGLLAQYEQIVSAMKSDSERVREQAIALNRKNRNLLDPRFLPSPPPHLRPQLPGEFHLRLRAAFDALLNEVNAGLPPDPNEVKREINAERIAFISQSFQKDESDDLTEEERERLSQLLAGKRLNKYAERASAITYYADATLFSLPDWDVRSMPDWPLSAWYNYQWEYWIAEDILRGLQSANAITATNRDDSVLRAPMKRVLRMSPRLPQVSLSGDRSGGGTGRPAGRSSGGAMGLDGGGAPGMGSGSTEFSDETSGGGSLGGGGGTLNWKDAIQPQYSASFTGRVSNSLYDVILVDLDLVVATDRIPAVINALCKQNFFTVINMSVKPRDIYADLSEGFHYGSQPVSEVQLVLETIWLREWMIPLMPEETKNLLGVGGSSGPAPMGSNSDFEEF